MTTCAYAGCRKVGFDRSAAIGEVLCLCDEHGQVFENMLMGFRMGADYHFQKIFRWYKCGDKVHFFGHEEEAKRKREEAAAA